VNDGAGDWMDGRGTMHAFGAAFGNPTTHTMTNGYARGVGN
jgi:hypothetical protein